MRRRSSGSATEEDDDSSAIPDAPAPPAPASLSPEHGDKRLDDLTTYTPRTSTDGVAKERRRNNETVARASLTKSRIWSEPHTAPTSEKDTQRKMMDNMDIIPDDMAESYGRRRSRWRNPWSLSTLTVGVLVAALVLLAAILQSFFYTQLDPKGCAMSRMWAAYVKYEDFDTEHTRFASKYSLYQYREGGIDEDARVKGVPVLFIPGNAGSYKQVRSLAAEAAYHFHDHIQNDPYALADGKRALDFFSVDFNEDITAFHGQTLLDQAEYLNDAVAYILSLYHNPARSARSPELPDPSSVIIVGHSMGGIVARTMLTMSNYQANSVNTIITLSAPHARPPVSFDSDIVSTYKTINDYWRQAYSQRWANDNPLWHVTLISIAGGGLDNVVPSDYASISSLVPETHGFTVFTASIPHVWTGMDHLAITWCDQFRKSVIRALFKKFFLTGLEDIAEKTLPHKDPKTLLTLEDNSNSIISQGERLVLRSFGQQRKPKAYLLPVPPQGAPEGRKFTLLTDQKIDATEENGKLEVLFCSVFPLQAGQSAAIFSMDMDLSGDSSGSTRLACKNAASDVIHLPASTKNSQFPFDNAQPFSYLQYDLEDLADHQFIAVVDKAVEHTNGWVLAEFMALILRKQFKVYDETDFTKNDLLLGSQDTFFWFLVPLFGLMCTGFCVAINYTTLVILHIFGAIYSWYTEANYNFFNYCHTILVLMIWILPINLPVLVVWVRNLAVHWLTPFSSHHNILSIMPFILLVETLSTGRMVPRVTNRFRYFTNILLFGLAGYAAIYGVTYAYLLHHIANILCAWLVCIHLSSTSLITVSRNLGQRFDSRRGDAPGGGHVKKRP
ncbi:putative gpi inositol-deacylase protein [Neofusicoccum parvum UCRNP2]|uniref:GPI inositol-deacylase n=1 Tax=Botryosphaeria parva (strain UCR-NP2) TaxID=1287680 RepID=R1GUP7_BOTPV|nr:putative gpi inositol-deacylase protein [Neofusicoccum parvum UCRNP2]